MVGEMPSREVPGRPLRADRLGLAVAHGGASQRHRALYVERTERETWLSAAELARVFATTLAHNAKKLANVWDQHLHEETARQLQALAKLYDAEAARAPVGPEDQTPAQGIPLWLLRQTDKDE